MLSPPSRRPIAFAMMFLFLAHVLLVPVGTAVFVEVDGKDSTDHSGDITECTPALNARSGHMCDDDDSIHVGAYDYGTGASIAEWEFTVPDEACLKDEEFRVVARIQTNGPTGERGWGKAMTSSNQNYVGLFLKDHDGEEWDWLDATAHYKYFGNNQYGTIPINNDNRNFRTHTTATIPTNGTISRTGEQGKYILEGPQNGESTIELRLKNNPYGGSTSNNLRTEVDWIRIDYDHETVPPSNPSGTPTVSSVPGEDGFGGLNTWTKGRAFNLIWNDAGKATDNCKFDKLEFKFTSNGSTTAVSNWESTSPNGKNRLWVPNSNGEYDLYYRAVDEAGNKGQWAQLNGVFKLDRQAPTPSTITSWNGWYSMQGSSVPEISWSPWTDNDAGMKNYTLTLKGDSGWSFVQSETDSSPSNVYRWTPTTGDLNKFSQPDYCGENIFRLRGSDNATPDTNSDMIEKTIKIDTCEPLVTGISSPSNGWYTTQTPSLSFSAPNDADSGVNSCFLTFSQVNQSIPVSVCTSSQPSHSTYLPDGAHYVELGACDLVGNCNSSTSLIKIDSAPPRLVSFSSSTHQNGVWTNNSQLQLGLSFEESTTATTNTVSGMKRAWATTSSAGGFPTASQIKSDASTTCSPSGTCSLSINKSLPSGRYSVHYIAEDLAGNDVQGTLNLTVAVDINAPTSVTPNFAQSIVAGTNAALLWTASQDAHSGVNHYQVNFTNLDLNSTTSQLVSGTTWNISNLQEGNYSACVIAVDHVGLRSQPSCTTQNLVVDLSAPTLQSSINVTGWTNGQNSVKLTWDVEDNGGSSSVRYRLNNGTLSTPQGSNGTANFTSLVDGWYTLQVIATDGAGNQIVATHSFGIDMQKPTVSFSSPLGSSWSNVQEQLVQWSATDPASGSGLDEIVLSVNNANEDDVLRSGQRMFELPSGIHTLQLTATDLAGNSHTTNLVLRIDHAVPIANCSISPSSWTNGALSVHVMPNANGSISPFDWALTLPSGVEDTTAVSGVNLYNPGLGLHTYKLRAWNAAGTYATCQVIGKVDTLAPVFISHQLPNEYINENQTSFTVEAIDLGDAGLNTYSLKIDGVEMAQGAFVNGRYNLDFTNLNDGVHDFSFTVTDRAGNAHNLTKKFTLDRLAPSIEQFFVVNPTVNGWIADSALNIAWAASDNLDSNLAASVLLNGAPFTFPGTFSPTQISVPDGVHTLGLRVVDRAGNVQVQSMTIQVDSTDPVCRFARSVGTGWTAEHSVTITPECDTQLSGLTLTASLNDDQDEPLSGPMNFSLEHGNNTIEVRATSGANRLETWTLKFSSDQFNPSAQTSITDADMVDDYADGSVSFDYSIPSDLGAPFNYSILLNGEYRYNSSRLQTDVVDNFLFSELDTGPYEIRLEVVDEAGRRSTFTEELEVVRDDEPLSVQCKTTSGLELTPHHAPDYQIIKRKDIGRGKFICDVDDGTSTLNLLHERNEYGAVWASIDGKDAQITHRRGDVFEIQTTLHEDDYTGPAIINIFTVDRWGNFGNQTIHLYVVYDMQVINEYGTLGGVATFNESLSLNAAFLLVGFHLDEEPTEEAEVRIGDGPWTPATITTMREYSEAGGKRNVIVNLAITNSDINQSGTTEVSLKVTAADGIVDSIARTFHYNLTLCATEGLIAQVDESNYTVHCLPEFYVGPVFPEDSITIADDVFGSFGFVGREGAPWDAPADCTPSSSNERVNPTVETAGAGSGLFNVSTEEKVNLRSKITLTCRDIHGLETSFSFNVSFTYEPSTIEQIQTLVSDNLEGLVVMFLLAVVLVSRMSRTQNTTDSPTSEKEETT